MEPRTTQSTQESLFTKAASTDRAPDTVVLDKRVKEGWLAAGTGRVQRGAPGPVLALSAGQGVPSGSVLPALHANPAGHCPVQDAFTMASESPYLPAGQTGQTANPPGLKRPAGHTAPAVLLELLAGQAYPGAQGPLHTATGIAVVFPKRPAGHGRQTGSWLVRYVPTAHATAVALELPAGQ